MTGRRLIAGVAGVNGCILLALSVFSAFFVFAAVVCGALWWFLRRLGARRTAESAVGQFMIWAMRHGGEGWWPDMLLTRRHYAGRTDEQIIEEFVRTCGANAAAFALSALGFGLVTGVLWVAMG